MRVRMTRSRPTREAQERKRCKVRAKWISHQDKKIRYKENLRLRRSGAPSRIRLSTKIGLHDRIVRSRSPKTQMRLSEPASPHRTRGS